MVTFRRKRIVTVKSAGEYLAKARVNLGLTLKAAERRLNISERYLVAMENNNWQDLPGDIYARNFIAKYAFLLGLDGNEIIRMYNDGFGHGRANNGQRQKKVNWRKKLRAISFLSLPTILRNATFLFFVLLVSLYIGFQFWRLLAPPRLELLYPKNNIQLNNEFVKILGKADKNATLLLNDEEVSLDHFGFFQVALKLNQGMNVIKVEAARRHGKKNILYQQIIVN